MSITLPSERKPGGFQNPSPSMDKIPSESHRFDALISDSLIAYNHAKEANLLYSAEELIASGTWQKYEQRAAALARSHQRNDPFAVFLSHDRFNTWSNANTRQSARSALVRIASQKVRESVPAYWRELFSMTLPAAERTKIIKALNGAVDAEAMERMRSARQPLNREEWECLTRAIAFLVAVPPDPMHCAVRKSLPKDEDKPKKQVSSAIIALRALGRHERGKQKKSPDYEWRNQFWKTGQTDACLSTRHRIIIATLMLIGCRPVEFSARLGVTVDIATEGGILLLTFTVKGAKTALERAPEVSGKGQGTRTIRLVCKTEEACWLHDHISRSGTPRLEIKEATNPRSPSGMWLSRAEQERRLTVSIDKYIKRVGKRAFPKQTNSVTPYLFRHALAADMQADESFSDEAITATLGHQSTRTARRYGGSNRGRRTVSVRAEQIIQVDASSPIRGCQRDCIYDARGSVPPFSGSDLG